ncbi:hypothetical protein Q8G50_34885, partial [Klebsiella pneumoniae]
MRQGKTLLSMVFAGIVAFFSFFMPPAAFAGTGPDAEGGAPDGELYVIGTDTTFAPFEFRDPSGELVGID